MPPPPVKFDPNKPFTFVDEEEEEKELEFDPNKPFTFIGEEVEREERKSMPAAPYFAERDKLMEAREKRHSDAKQALIAGLKLPAPASEVQQAEPAFGLDETWGLLKGISAKNWDTDDEEAKREGMADFSHEFFKVMVTPSLRQQLWKKVDASNFGDRLKFYRTLHDANEWAVGDKSPVIPEAARDWLKLKEEGLPTTGKGSRAALRMGTEITERMPKPKDTGFFRGPQARDFDPRVWLSETRKFASAVGRDIVEGAASLQVGPSGPRGTKTPGGEIGAAFKGEDPAAIQAQRPEFVTEVGGLAGAIGPEIAATMLMQPQLVAWMQSARIPVTVEGLLGAKAYRASKKGQEAMKIMAQSTTLAAAGGGLKMIEGGNFLEVMAAGATWAALPVLHRAASQRTGDILTKLLSKRKKISDATKFEQALVAESAGMGAALAAIESPQMVAWLQAETDEEKDRILGGMLSRLGAFWAMGYGRVAKAEARGESKVPRTPEKERGLERFTEKAKKELQAERDINLLIEELKGSPESMKQLRDSLDKYWDAHEAVPRGAGVAEVVGRLEALKKGQNSEVQAAITKMQEEVRLFQVGKPTVEPGVVDPVTGRKLRPKKLPAEEAIPTEEMEAARRMGEVTEAGERLGDLEKKMEDIYPRGVSAEPKEALMGALREAGEAPKLPAEAAADVIRAQEKPPAELPAEILPPELPADIPPYEPPPSDAGGLMGRMFPQSGRMLPRSFSEAVIKHYKSTNQKERAAEFERDRDNIYEELPVTEASKFIRSVTDVELERMAQQKGIGKKLWHWENVIDADRIRRWEEKGDPESLALADDLLAEKSPTSTGYGQWLQQLTLFNNSTGSIIKGVDKSLQEQHRPKLTGDQISELRRLIQKTKAANEKFEKANDLYREKPTKANFDKMVDTQWYATLRQKQQSGYARNFLPERTWAEWATAQIQGGLLTPGSQVLNIGSVILMKPIRAAARGVDSASDLLYAKTVGGGKDVLGRRVMIPNPIKGVARSIRGFGEATGVPKYAGRVIEALREDRGLGGEFGDWWDISGTRGEAAGLGLKPSPMARWSQKDWKGAQTMLDVAIQGAESSPYELKGVNLRPINSRAAMQQLQRLIYEDVIRYESKPVKILGKHFFNVPGGLRKFNAGAKNFFEASFGMPADVMFTGLYWGDAGFRKGAEFRIFGNWAQQKLSEMDLTPEQRQERIGMAMEDPRTLFTAQEIAYGKQLGAQEVYQGDNYVTELIGSGVEKLRKDWPLAHFGLRVVVPYMKTPMNVAGEVLAYTPGGAMMNVTAKSLQIKYESHRKGGYDKVSKSSKDALKRATGQMAMAYGISQFANYLSDYGLVTPHLPPGEHPEKERRFARLHVPPGSINLSGFGRSFPVFWKANQDRLFRIISAEEFEEQKERAKKEGEWREGDTVSELGRTSAGIIIGLNVDVNKRLELLPAEDRNFLHTQMLGLQAELGMATHFMLAQDYTQTMGEVANVIQGKRWANAASLGSKLFETASTVFIPRTFSWADMIEEENIPTFRGDTFENQFRDKIQARIDSVDFMFRGGKAPKIGRHRDELPKILDMRGKEVLRTPSGDKYVLGGLVKTESALLWHMLGLSKVRKTSAAGDIPILDPTVMEILRLSRKLKGKLDRPDTSLVPSWPSPIINEKSEIFPNFPPYEMSPKQFEDFQKMVGEFRFKGIPKEYIETVNAGLPADRRIPIKATRGIDAYVASNSYWAGKTDEDRARGIKSRLDYGLKVAKQIYLKRHRDDLKAIPPRTGKKFD